MSTSTLILEMVPLGLASAISPTLLSVTVVILSSKIHSKFRALAYLAGAGLAIVAVFLVALEAGSAAARPAAGRPSTLSASIDLLLGGLLILAGFRSLLKKPDSDAGRRQRSKTEPDRLGPILARETGLGVIMSLTNFSSLVFIMTAGRETARSGADLAGRALAMTTVIGLYLIPIILPLALTFIAPVSAAKVLEAVNRGLKKYGRFLLAAIALAFGVWLLWRGAKGF